MTRTALPNRRPCATQEAVWTAPDGAAHTFTIISIALQNDITPADLAKSLGRVPVYGEDAPASPIGVIMAEVRKAAE